MHDATPARAGTYHLRACAETDADFVVALIETVMRAHVEATWGRWRPDYHRFDFHSAFGRLDHSIIVCDGAAAGYLAVQQRERAVYLQKLFLLPAYQNRGIGSAVLADLIAAAQAAAKPLQLRVLVVNTDAQRLYERFGFDVTGTADGFVSMERPLAARPDAPI